MGSAVSSVFGGGGSGGILGAIGGIVGGIFGGPIGSMIGQAVGNLLNQAIGQAFNQSIDDLVKNHGMPKFLGDEVKAKANETLGGLQHQNVSDEATNAAQNHFGAAINEFKQNFAADMTSRILEILGKRASGGDESSSVGGGKGGRTAGAGWLQAIAAAMGEALGDKAAQMVSLSEQMTKLNATAKEGADKVSNLANAAADGDKKAGSQLAGAQTQDQANARAFNMAMTQFQATSQEYSMLNNVFSTAIKALGESLSSMARKQ
jgi:hypothetical protein